MARLNVVPIWRDLFRCGRRRKYCSQVCRTSRILNCQAPKSGHFPNSVACPSPSRDDHTHPPPRCRSCCRSYTVKLDADVPMRCWRWNSAALLQHRPSRGARHLLSVNLPTADNLFLEALLSVVCRQGLRDRALFIIAQSQHSSPRFFASFARKREKSILGC
jgi:hypothetical protein